MNVLSSFLPPLLGIGNAVQAVDIASRSGARRRWVTASVYIVCAYIVSLALASFVATQEVVNRAALWEHSLAVLVPILASLAAFFAARTILSSRVLVLTCSMVSGLATLFWYNSLVLLMAAA